MKKSLFACKGCIRKLERVASVPCGTRCFRRIGSRRPRPRFLSLLYKKRLLGRHNTVRTERFRVVSVPLTDNCEKRLYTLFYFNTQFTNCQECQNHFLIIFSPCFHVQKPLVHSLLTSHFLSFSTPTQAFLAQKRPLSIFLTFFAPFFLFSSTEQLKSAVSLVVITFSILPHRPLFPLTTLYFCTPTTIMTNAFLPVVTLHK